MSERVTPRRVAAFDFDGTLTRHDSLAPFLARVVGWGRLAAAALRDAPALARVAAGRGDRDLTKERLLVRLLAGEERQRLHRLGTEYGALLAHGRIRPEMRARVEWHRSQGHELVIVSASLDVYLEEVARRLGFDAVLCTSLEYADDGRCTGRLLGGNCRAQVKADRLHAYLAGEAAELWAYGDSAGDDAMLAMADHPVRV